jgi:hypothetical protein
MSTHLNLPFNDGGPFPNAYIVRDLSRIAFVVHEKKFEFSNIADSEFFKTVGEAVACFLVASVANLKSLISANGPIK